MYKYQRVYNWFPSMPGVFILCRYRRVHLSFVQKLKVTMENQSKAGSYDCHCDSSKIHYNGSCVDVALLILKSSKSYVIKELYSVKKAMLSVGLKFNVTDFQVFQSCSLVFNNQMFVFGGQRQGTL